MLGLDDEKGQQELRPRGPSAMLPLSPILKDAFEKFEQDFLASNLPKGKYIKPPASAAKYYKVPGLLSGRPKTKYWMGLTLGSSSNVAIRMSLITLI